MKTLPPYLDELRRKLFRNPRKKLAKEIIDEFLVFEPLPDFLPDLKQYIINKKLNSVDKQNALFTLEFLNMFVEAVWVLRHSKRK